MPVHCIVGLGQAVEIDGFAVAQSGKTQCGQIPDVVEMLVSQQDRLDIALFSGVKGTGGASGVESQHAVDEKAWVPGMAALIFMGAKDSYLQDYNSQECNSGAVRAGIGFMITA